MRTLLTIATAVIAAAMSCLSMAADQGHHAGAHRSFDEPATYSRRWDDPARDEWQRPAELVAALGVEPGMAVADIGTGTGYLLPHLSRAAGARGKVYAVDISAEMLRWVEARAEREGLANVEAVGATERATGLPAGAVDRAIMINVWHHVADPEGYARDMYRALRDDGVLFIVEARPGLSEEGGPPEHFRLPPETVIEQLKAAGFTARVEDFPLDRQYVVRGER